MCNVLLFGDQTAEQIELLHKITLRSRNAILVSFLERTSAALREEVARLSSTHREGLPDFLTIKDLVREYGQRKARLPQLDSALVTIAQLGHYMGYFSENTSALPSREDTRVLALCTGSLAAAAVVSARSLSELIPIAVEAVRIAFRSGLHIYSIAQALEQTDASWSTIVTGVSEQTAHDSIDAFHSSYGIPTTSRVYVSAVSTMALTLTGPPSVLERLFESSKTLVPKNRVSIPVFGPYHAPHLHTLADIERLIPASSRDLLTQYQPACLIHSASTGKVLSAKTAYNLFVSSLQDMFQHPVRWDYLLQESISHLSIDTMTSATIFAMGVNNVANSLASAIRAGGQESVAIVDQAAWDTTKIPTSQGRTQNDKIAIVGMAGRYPNAADHEALWELLQSGLDVHRKIPKSRFDPDSHCDPSGKGKNKSHTPYGCFIDDPGLFDPRFFNMSPREAAQTDPMGRLALTTAYEALEQSGYVPNRTPSTKSNRIGTFYGQTSDDWREVNAGQNIDTYHITGGIRAFAPGRINYYFKFSGPSYSVDTACSSSLAAIQLACTSLWAGDCDTACCGGMNVMTSPDIYSGLSKGQFLSKTGSCKTFDNTADGYCRGESVGTFVLKRYEDAIADNDNILGSILGVATNHSAQAVSITHPHAGAQEYLFKKVCADAGVDVHDVSYVEMHGTGTQAGDCIEMMSVTNSFAPRDRRRTPEQKLHLGAIKANIGHGEAASGVNSLTKMLMMLRNNSIPANVGIKTGTNQNFPQDLAERQVIINTAHVPYPRKGAETRKMLLNNFSAAGGNSSLLLEDGPLKEAPKSIDPRSTLPITISARSIGALTRNVERLQKFLAENRDVTLPSLSYTTTARRIQHNYRISFPASDISKVGEQIRGQVRETYQPVPLVATKTAFCFTGQGSQYTALGQKLYQNLPNFKDDIDQLDSIARIQGLPSFIEVLDGTDIQTLSPVKVQLGMVCIQVALARMWAAWGVTPTAVIGHSLGEYAALHVAGCISASDMIMLVGRRAELLIESCTPHTHGMLAVKGSIHAIRRALGDDMIEVACINGPEETVLCGSGEVVSAANAILNSNGFKATKLNVPFAFHSAQVDAILAGFQKIAKAVVFTKPSIPILSPLTGRVIRDAHVFNAEYLARHARETVDFSSALTSGLREKAFDEKTVWIEIGAHPVCSGMVKTTIGAQIAVPSLRRGEDPWKTISTTICAVYNAGVNINFDQFHKAFNSAHELLTLPTYSFDSKKYWIDYTNNWTLTKGEALTAVVAPAPARVPVVVAAPSYKKLSDSCQQVIEETFTSNKAKVVVRSDVTKQPLRKVVTGHLVNNTALCPSSLYYDMALTVAEYAYKGLRPTGVAPGYNVANMEVTKPFIVKMDPPADGQHIELEVNADLDKGLAKVCFRSVTPSGKLMTNHAECVVKFEDIAQWQESWDSISYMVKGQIDNLVRKTKSQEAHMLGRGLAYKLFKVFVDYEETYRGMDEVICDNNITEATAAIKFKTTPSDGEYRFPAYWCDSMAHLAGFIINATDLCDTDNYVCVSHGWGSIKLAKPMSADKKYRNYVRMVEKPGNIRVGDVWVFDEDGEVVGVIGQIKFQQIPRRVLNTFLPPQVKARTPMAATATAHKATAPAPAPTSDVIAAPRKIAPTPTPTAVPTTSKKAVVFEKSAGLSLVSNVMSIIAVETDVDASELTDGAGFENLGVDSLMSLSISAKFREELDMNISPTLFSDYPTVGEMKAHFAQYDSPAPSAIVEDDSDADSVEPSPLATPAAVDNYATPQTPLSCASSASSDSPKFGKARLEIGGEIADVSLARHIVAQEMGIDISEIVDDADLSNMGMDSLMSLTILGELREKTGIDLPSTFLSTHKCIAEIENALGMRSQPKAAAKVSVVPAAIVAPKSAPQLERVNDKLRQAIDEDISRFPAATSVLLQGNAKVATKKVFFLPDGSGSATSYVSIPNLGSDVAAYGLNCPFMKDPERWTCGIETISMVYLAEIKRRQPVGPYTILGWSAGGVLAYACAQALLANGEQVDKLLLLDSPCPAKLAPISVRLHNYFNESGLLGTGDPAKTPKWQLPHFRAADRELSAYEPVPLVKAIPTYAIWCREGVAGNPGDARPQRPADEAPCPSEEWLLNHRTDFSDNGWAQLCGKENMKFGVMDGHHFSMMKAPHADTLGRLIRQGLDWKA